MKTLLAFILVVAVSFCDAQKPYSISNAYPWCSWFTNAGARTRGTTAFTFSYGYLYTPADEVILTTRGVDDEPGLAKFNSTGKKVWELKQKSSLEVSSLNNNIITFYLEPSPEKKRHSILHAVLVDPEKGRMIRQKELGVYKDFDYKFSVIKDNASKFHGLAMTYTDGTDWKVDKLDILTFDDQLNTSNELHFSYAKDYIYYGITANTQGEYFIASSKAGFTVDRVNKKGEVLSSLNYPENIYTQSYAEQITLQPSAEDPLRLLAGIWHHADGPNNIQLLMDFNSNKVLSVKDKLNREFEKLIKSKTHETGPFSFIEGLRIRGFAETRDKIISVREIENFNPKGLSIFEGLVISLYNKQLQTPSYFIIPKSMLIITYPTGTPGFHLRDNKLYIVYPLRSGLNSFYANGYVLDLATETLQPIDFSSINNPKTACLEGDATCWFKDSYLLQYKDVEGRNRKVESYLQRMDY